MPLTVGLISLGCPKNLVDSEIMIGHLQKAGMTMTPEPELADVMVVNTCAFIDQAKQEAIDADDYSGVNVMHIGGESLLNLPQQEAVWFEMTQE